MTVVNLLMQIPLAGIVVVVVYIFLKYERENIKATNDNRDMLTKHFLTELKDYRLLYETTINKLADKISNLSSSVDLMCSRVDNIEEKFDDFANKLAKENEAEK